ncbi:hypothetical protein SFUMM280S_06588 [Streptomyces fumanus]
MTVMPAALAAARPRTPQAVTAPAPSTAVAARPAAIAAAGYQLARPAEKYVRASAPTTVWASSPSA